jgi:hypothetical protein
VRPVVLRDETPPDDVAIVVRGGLLTPDSVLRTTDRCRREYGFLGLSVYGAIGMTITELVAAVPQIGLTRYRQLRLSTFGALRVAGFPVWPTNQFPHFSIVLPDVEPSTLTRLERCFGPAVQNRTLS